MKTLQIKPGVLHDGSDMETLIWEDKSAKDVLREQYHDNCIIKPTIQPRSNSTKVHRPTTYQVYDRTDSEDRNDIRESVGTLIEQQ